jgi:hypothetical protein
MSGHHPVGAGEHHASSAFRYSSLVDIRSQIDVQSLRRGPRCPWARVAGETDHRVHIRELCHPGVVPFREISRLDFSIATRVDIQQPQRPLQGKEMRPQFAADVTSGAGHESTVLVISSSLSCLSTVNSSQSVGGT